jgi:hypothetical protein
MPELVGGDTNCCDRGILFPDKNNDYYTQAKIIKNVFIGYQVCNYLNIDKMRDNCKKWRDKYTWPVIAKEFDEYLKGWVK